MLRVALFILLLIIILVAVNFPRFRRTLGVTLVLIDRALSASSFGRIHRSEGWNLSEFM